MSLKKTLKKHLGSDEILRDFLFEEIFNGLFSGEEFDVSFQGGYDVMKIHEIFSIPEPEPIMDVYTPVI